MEPPRSRFYECGRRARIHLSGEKAITPAVGSAGAGPGDANAGDAGPAVRHDARRGPLAGRARRHRRADGRQRGAAVPVRPGPDRPRDRREVLGLPRPAHRAVPEELVRGRRGRLAPRARPGAAAHDQDRPRRLARSPRLRRHAVGALPAHAGALSPGRRAACAHGGWKDALTVLYREDRPVIRPVEARRLELLVPHLARAIEMQRPFRLLQRRFGQVLAALDRLGLGVLVVRDAREIVLANREAERILARGRRPRALRAREGRARGTPTPPLGSPRRWSAPPTPRGSRSSTAAHTLEIPRRSGGEPYLVDVVPLRDDGDEMGSAFDGVLLVLIDPDHREMVSIQGLARSYALSPTETLVCRMIVQGLTQQEIADAREVSARHREVAGPRHLHQDAYAEPRGAGAPRAQRQPTAGGWHREADRLISPRSSSRGSRTARAAAGARARPGPSRTPARR